MYRYCLALVVFVVALYSSQAERVISGQITHAGLKSLPKNVQIEVELRDVSLMDAPSKKISSTLIKDATSFPVDYKITYDPKLISVGHQYSVSARIVDSDGKLIYINDVNTRADVSGTKSGPTNIGVIKVGDSSATSHQKPNVNKACPQACRGKPKACPYGYQKKDGCEICKCHDPCNPPGKPVLCGAKQRCFVEKKADGTFAARCDSVPSKKGPTNKPECAEPKVVGMCRAAHPRFYFDSTTKTCEPFNYGGCGGNKNNFLSKQACEKACKA